MTTYICETCNKTFKQKGHFTSHKARKNPCVKSDLIEKLVETKVQDILAKTFPGLGTTIPSSTPLICQNAPKPFIKWVGGKTQIIDRVMERLPAEINNYHEPFLGGGSVLLSVLFSPHIRISGKIYASDLNQNVIALYRNVQTRPEELIGEVDTIIREYAECNGTAVNRKPANIVEAMTSPESYYFWIRAKFNALSKDERIGVKASAMMLFMNKTCFRGVYREGPNGFNVPFGNYKNPSILDAEHIRRVSTLIQPVIFSARDFAESLSAVEPGDFVYLDPPYAPENDKSFVSYNADGFNLKQHNALFKTCGMLTDKNVKLLMSNADVELVREAFKDRTKYEVDTISCRRAIHSKTPEARTNEVLIRNLLTEHMRP